MRAEAEPLPGQLLAPPVLSAPPQSPYLLYISPSEVMLRSPPPATPEPAPIDYSEITRSLA